MSADLQETHYNAFRRPRCKTCVALDLDSSPVDLPDPRTVAVARNVRLSVALAAGSRHDPAVLFRGAPSSCPRHCRPGVLPSWILEQRRFIRPTGSSQAAMPGGATKPWPRDGPIDDTVDRDAAPPLRPPAHEPPRSAVVSAHDRSARRGRGCRIETAHPARVRRRLKRRATVESGPQAAPNRRAGSS